MGEKEQFQQWLADTYGEQAVKRFAYYFSIPGDSWKDTEQYRHWKDLQEYQVATAGYGTQPPEWGKYAPGLKEGDYENALHVYLQGLIQTGEMTQGQAGMLQSNALNRVDSEGIHSGLPYYWDIAQARPEITGGAEAERTRQEMLGEQGRWRGQQWAWTEEERLRQAREAEGGRPTAWEARQRVPTAIGAAGGLEKPRSWIERYLQGRAAAEIRAEGGRPAQWLPPTSAAQRSIMGIGEGWQPAQWGLYPQPGGYLMEGVEMPGGETAKAYQTPAGKWKVAYSGGERGGTLPEQWQPKTPPTPEWLPKFAPQAEVGEPIQKWQPTLLSGQQAQKISPTEWAGFGGYEAWRTGLPYEEAMADYEKRVMETWPTAQARRGKWSPRRV